MELVKRMSKFFAIIDVLQNSRLTESLYYTAMSSGSSSSVSNNAMGPFSTEYGSFTGSFLYQMLMCHLAQDRGLYPLDQWLDANNRSSYLFHLCWPLLPRRLFSLP